MAVYVSLFNYSPEGASGISAKRTDQAREIVEKNGGRLIAAYGVLGPHDAMIIAEYPDEKAATASVMRLCSLLGASSQTMTVLPIEEFDRIAAQG